MMDGIKKDSSRSDRKPGALALYCAALWPFPQSAAQASEQLAGEELERFIRERRLADSSDYKSAARASQQLAKEESERFIRERRLADSPDYRKIEPKTRIREYTPKGL